MAALKLHRLFFLRLEINVEMSVHVRYYYKNTQLGIQLAFNPFKFPIMQHFHVIKHPNKRIEV